MSRNSLTKNNELRKGDYLVSNNKNYKAQFQEDGNFVVYGWRPVWASDTYDTRDAHRLCMQEDCNLVMYKQDGKPMWHTNSNCRPDSFKMCHLQLQDDGTLVVEKEDQVVWSSATSKGMK